MRKIDLRKYYPEIYSNSCVTEVSEAVYEVLRNSIRAEMAFQRRKYRHGAQYSLDMPNGIENKTPLRCIQPEDLYEQREHKERLLRAIQLLRKKPARRIYMHYFLGMSVQEIAKREGVSKSRVSESISRGLRKLGVLLRSDI